MGSVVLTELLTVSNTISMDTVVTTLAEHPRGWAPPWAAVEAARSLSGAHLVFASRLLPLNKGALGDSGHRERSLGGCAVFSVILKQKRKGPYLSLNLVTHP